MYNQKNFKRSRNAYTFECAFEYFVSLLVADSCLAILLRYLGISDALVGVISSIISLSFLFQLCAVPVVRHIKNTKRFSTIFHMCGQFFFLLLFVIPFLPFSSAVRRVLVFVFIILAYFGNYFSNVSVYRWGNSFVQPNLLGKFAARKEIISLISGLVVQLVTGFVFDYYANMDKIENAFLFASISMAVYEIGDFICLLSMDKEPFVATEEMDKKSLKDVLQNTLGLKSFRHAIIVDCFYAASCFAVTGFLGTYKVQELSMSMSLVQWILVGGALVRALASNPFGNYADKTSFVRAGGIGLLFHLLASISLIFTAPSTWWLIIAFYVFRSIGYAGTTANFWNMPYLYVDRKYFSEAFAIKNATSGLAGFLSSVVCGIILDAIQNNGNTLFDIHLYGQQFLAIISAVLALAGFLFARLVLEKDKVNDLKAASNSVEENKE